MEPRNEHHRWHLQVQLQDRNSQRHHVQHHRQRLAGTRRRDHRTGQRRWREHCDRHVLTLARAIAERAKDAHFRFFAWTIGALPLPRAWRRGPRAAALLALSRDGHERESLDAERAAELDRMVGAAYGLDERDLATLARFDAWLRGQS